MVGFRLSQLLELAHRGRRTTHPVLAVGFALVGAFAALLGGSMLAALLLRLLFPGGSAETTPDDLSFLCKGVSAGDYINLEVEARGRVEHTVEEFVLTAYGDPGADPAKYEKAVEGLVMGDCFWGSPASGYVNDMEEVARSGGKANAASGSYDSPTFARELSHFEIDYAQRVEDYESGASFTKVVGTAVWVSEESNGDPRAWQQSITAVRNDAGGDWEILSGQIIPPFIKSEYEHYLPPGM